MCSRPSRQIRWLQRDREGEPRLQSDPILAERHLKAQPSGRSGHIRCRRRRRLRMHDAIGRDRDRLATVGDEFGHGLRKRARPWGWRHRMRSRLGRSRLDNEATERQEAKAASRQYPRDGRVTGPDRPARSPSAASRRDRSPSWECSRANARCCRCLARPGRRT